MMSCLTYKGANDRCVSQRKRDGKKVDERVLEGKRGGKGKSKGER